VEALVLLITDMPWAQATTKEVPGGNNNTVGALGIARLVARDNTTCFPRSGSGTWLWGGKQVRVLGVVGQRERLPKRTRQSLLLHVGRESSASPATFAAS
jgi:hypothetical protein